MQSQSVLFLFLLLVRIGKSHVHEEEVVVKMFGGPLQARMVANEMGYYFKGPVSFFLLYFNGILINLFY